MRYSILFFFLCLCSGCELSTKEITYKLEECNKEGLNADVYRLFGDGKIVSIQCSPKK